MCLNVQESFARGWGLNNLYGWQGYSAPSRVVNAIPLGKCCDGQLMNLPHPLKIPMHVRGGGTLTLSHMTNSTYF